MTFTIEQLEARRQFVGASEAAAVLGRSPWETPADIYWQKVTPPAPDDPTPAQARGTRLEPIIVQWALDRLGAKAAKKKPETIRRGVLGALLDCKISRRDEAIEAKSSTQPDRWGEEGTDQIPLEYLIQTQDQMHVCDLRRVWVPVLILAGFREEWRLYCVDRNEELGATIEKRITEWWDRHIATRTPPKGFEIPPMEILKQLRREPKSQVVVGANGVEIIDRWQEVKKQAEQWKRDEETAKAEVLALFGIDNPAEQLILPDGRNFTYLEQRSAPSVDFARFRAEHMDIYAQLVRQGTHRMLREFVPQHVKLQRKQQQQQQQELAASAA